MDIQVDLADRSKDDVQSFVLEQVFGGTVLRSIQRADGTHWGPPAAFTSGEFKNSFATVNVEEWLTMHDNEGHGREKASPQTVDYVADTIENGRESDIETPPFVLEPTPGDRVPNVDFHTQTGTVSYGLTFEGRSRAVGAKKAGVERIPVIVAVREPTK